MGLVINTNVASLNAQRNLGKTQSALSRSMQRLSSGLRINSAKDDAAGLAISDRMTAQIRGLNQAVRNANDGISLAQTAEGAMQESTNILQRMRELAVQSANASNSAADRAALQDEVNQLQSEMNRIANTTTFNGLKILDGSFSSQKFQIGANANQTISVSIDSMAADDLGRAAKTVTNTTANQGTGSATTAATSLPTNNSIAAQTLTIAGSEGTDTVSVTAGDSAYTIASNINNVTSSTGVEASAYNEASITAVSSDGTVQMTLGSGGSTATISASVTTSDLSNLVDAINKVAGTTGISAELDGGNVKLIQSEGKDIDIGDFTHSVSNATLSVESLDGNTETLTDADTDSTTIAGRIEFSSTESFSVRSSIANTAGSVLDVAADTFVNSSTDYVSAIDISTQTGAQSAIDVIDKALGKIDSQRGNLGAVQNRFESTIANLQNISENISAARSRILDADIAQETSEMTKQNILQQAGISILAQANQAPQMALSLLQ
ncbi:flagellin [Desulfolithobacter dissulfuricans]|uniref:Flagellin n=1 Tax=Desulfolithobacter dissulfuricans TaxID=2795293 RepID=A0A915XHB7_9BACT|nr:flagellin [Desulfolithobacter dissulfuricans]BCO08494.1 flagellin [Desulfolithobacter dissulfuricans]